MTHTELLDALNKLLPPQLETIIVKLGAPPHHLAGPTASQAARAIDLLRWADQQGRLAELDRLLAKELQATSAASASSTLAPAASLPTDVLLVTVTKIETQAVLEAFGALSVTVAATAPSPSASASNSPSPSPPVDHINGRVYFDLGDIHGARVRLTRSEMGTTGLGGAQQAVAESIAALSPAAVVMIGIAFGIDDQKQQIGDVLVSEQLRLYDLARIGTAKTAKKRGGKPAITLRGDKPHASPALINLYKSADTLWTGPTVRFGTIITGDKLIDNLDYRDTLRAHEPEAIGGEMEGAGLYVSCQSAKVDWILIKAICDFADGNKAQDKDARQRLAAKNAASFALHGLRFVKVDWRARAR